MRRIAPLSLLVLLALGCNEPSPAPKTPTTEPAAPHEGCHCHDEEPSSAASSASAPSSKNLTIIESSDAEGHTHKAPHNGIVRTVGKLHLELVLSEEHAELYLLDGELGLAKPLTATGVLIAESGALNVPLTYDATQSRLSGKLATKSEQLTAEVILGNTLYRAHFSKRHH